MEQQGKIIKGVITAFFAAVTAVIGWLGWLIIALIGLMTIDYLTGWIAARSRGEWQSSIAKKGIAKKVGILTIVVAAGMLDWLIGGIIENLPMMQIPITYTVLICPIVAIWFILAEIGSIIENSVCMGANCPDFIVKLINVLKSTIEKSGNKIAVTVDDKDDTKIDE
jgi:toxin secretion/phage lysis holin